jgi:DNA-binding NtrC family response regulator
MSLIRGARPYGIHTRPKVIRFPAAEARPDLVRPLREVIFDYVERAMILCDGNRKLAAQRLQISYRTLLTYVAEIRRERAL